MRENISPYLASPAAAALPPGRQHPFKGQGLVEWLLITGKYTHGVGSL